MNNQQKSNDGADVPTRPVRNNRQLQQQTTSRRSKYVLLAQRVIWYLAGVILTFLALRIVLLMMGADQSNPFVDFVETVSGFYAAPFALFLGTPEYGKFDFDVASAVAMVVYTVVAFGLVKAIGLLDRE